MQLKQLAILKKLVLPFLNKAANQVEIKRSDNKF
jgi:hypothetical protein